MTVTAGPEGLIDGPLPSPFPFNLLTVASLAGVEAGDLGGVNERWGLGATVQPYPTVTGGGVEPCDTGSLSAKDEGTAIENAVFGAFTAYVPVTCSAFGMGEWERFKDRANRVLDAVEAFHLEQQLATGVYKGDNPFLGDLNLDILNAGAAVGAEEGLALLVNAIAVTGRAGVIHATPPTVVAWSDFLVQPQGQLRTLG